MKAIFNLLSPVKKTQEGSSPMKEQENHMTSKKLSPNSLSIETLAILMQEDLRNEYTHMLFYLASSSTIKGIFRLEYQEWLEEESASEMGHVKEFSRLISSLGLTPVFSHHHFPSLHNVKEILEYAIKLEQEVCTNYAFRLYQIDELKKELITAPVEERDNFAVWSQIGLFYEEQLTHSHHDLNELRERCDCVIKF